MGNVARRFAATVVALTPGNPAYCFGAVDNTAS